MIAEVKEKDGREIYERKGKTSDIVGKIKVGVACFIAGVTLTLMFYPIIRP